MLRPRSLDRSAACQCVLNNLANSYGELGRLDKALDCYDRALAVDPAFVVAHLNKAATLVIAGQVGAALRQFEEALRYDPENANVHKSIGIARLMLGDFAGGWPEYEWRYKANDPTLPPIQPLWDGSPTAKRFC